MFQDTLHARGLVLLGCGKMGSAMLAGWLDQGLDPASVWVLDPHPSDWVTGLADRGLHLNTDLPDDPAMVIVAVKPQMMGDALPKLTPLGNGTTVFLSIAAGIAIARFQEILGPKTPIIRAMPNTPSAIGQGITALVGDVAESDLQLAETLLSAVGQTVRLDDEGQMDAVTALSGSGPAYVFHLIETMAAAGVDQGLPADMAMELARATVAGAGALAMQSDENPAQLRINVTSPGGTTAAALGVLMDPDNGFPTLLKRAIKAAADRSKELANG